MAETKVTLFEGDISDFGFENTLSKGYGGRNDGVLVITMIEVLEHIEPDLHMTVFQNIFGIL